MKINLIVIKTSNPDDLAAFYGRLGIGFEKHSHGNGPMHHAAEIDGVVFEIYPLPKGVLKADDTVRLGFVVDGLDKTIKKLLESGGKIIKEPSLTEWGYVSIIEDLDGRKIELKDNRK